MLDSCLLALFCVRFGNLVIPVFRNGVEVLTNTKVESITPDDLTLVKQRDGQRETQTVPYGACVWATGVAMHSLTRHLQEAMPQGSQTHNRYLHFLPLLTAALSCEHAHLTRHLQEAMPQGTQTHNR